jgi:hypothetical protein
VLRHSALAAWQQELAASEDPDLLLYAQCVPVPGLACVHNFRVPAAQAAAWARVRSGSSWLSAQRAARHMNGSSACALCGLAAGDVLHALVACPALADHRAAWWARAGAVRFPGLAPAEVPPALLLRWFCGGEATPPGIAALHACFATAIESAFARQVARRP